jgi:hypothetical protein
MAPLATEPLTRGKDTPSVERFFSGAANNRIGATLACSMPLHF